MKKNDLIALMRCTQTELAKLLGITQGAVAQWEEVPPAHYLRLRYEIAPRLAWPEKTKARK